MNDCVPTYQDLARFRVEKNFRGRSGLVVLAWQIVQPTLFGLSPQPFYGWRRALLRLFGANVGRGVLVRPTARVTYPWKVTLGDHCWIGDHAELYSLGPISIGAHAVVSQHSYLCSATHDIAQYHAFPWRLDDRCRGRSVGCDRLLYRAGRHDRPRRDCRRTQHRAQWTCRQPSSRRVLRHRS